MWLKSSGLKIETESLIVAAQEQALNTNTFKKSLCRLIIQEISCLNEIDATNSMILPRFQELSFCDLTSFGLASFSSFSEWKFFRAEINATTTHSIFARNEINYLTQRFPDKNLTQASHKWMFTWFPRNIKLFALQRRQKMLINEVHKLSHASRMGSIKGWMWLFGSISLGRQFKKNVVVWFQEIGLQTLEVLWFADVD